MKFQSIAFASVALAALIARADDKSAFKNEKEKASYAVGVNLVNSWKHSGIDRDDLDVDAIARGLKDGFSGENLRLSPDEVQAVLTKYQQDFTARQMEKRKIAGEKNKADGEKFLAENKNKPGVIILPSGLQYQVITTGAGEVPKSTDTVTVNYRGTLIDGTEFDHSAEGQPATFGVTRVIAGWTEALQLMKTGSKWKLFIPSALAYKENGSGPKIGPNAALVFDVELISIKPPAPPQTPPQPITSDIIKVPSAEEMKKGAKIETIKAEDIQKEIEKEKARQQPKK